MIPQTPDLPTSPLNHNLPEIEMISSQARSPGRRMEFFRLRKQPGHDEKQAHICASQAVNPRKNP
jgi:hypothetical protein